MTDQGAPMTGEPQTKREQLVRLWVATMQRLLADANLLADIANRAIHLAEARATPPALDVDDLSRALMSTPCGAGGEISARAWAEHILARLTSQEEPYVYAFDEEGDS